MMLVQTVHRFSNVQAIGMVSGFAWGPREKLFLCRCIVWAHRPQKSGPVYPQSLRNRFVKFFVSGDGQNAQVGPPPRAGCFTDALVPAAYGGDEGSGG